MEFCKHELPNGLEIIAERNPQAYATAVGFFVKTGSRDESTENSGVSHFLEHMVFKGTPRRSAADVNRQLDELGSHSNAYTSEEQTVYYMSVLPEYQAQAVELLADLMRPSLRQEDFDTEKQVILEEIAKYDDQPPFGAHELSMDVHFGMHPLSRSVLGTRESVGKLTREQMLEYFRARYSPGNMVLAASGAVDFDQLVRLAERHCGDWEPFATHRETPRAEACQRFVVACKEQASQEYVVQMSNAPATADSDRFANRTLATILGDDTGSRLYWELVDSGLAEFACLSPYEYQGTGVNMTFLCCAPEDTEANLQRIQQIYEVVQRDGVTAEELEQAKNKICAHIVLQAERSMNRLFTVGRGWMQRREYRTTRESVEAYQQVTLEQTRDVLSRYPLTLCSTVAVGPLKAPQFSIPVEAKQ